MSSEWEFSFATATQEPSIAHVIDHLSQSTLPKLQMRDVEQTNSSWIEVDSIEQFVELLSTIKLDMGERTVTLPKRYRMVKEIGAGSFGRVVAAWDTKLQRGVALKVELRPNSGVNRFQYEAQTLARLDHPNIMRIFDLENHNDVSFLVCELIDGAPLRHRLNEHLSWFECADICRTICNAVAYAHAQGVVHRDLKPDNILITPEGEVKILDFGLAKSDRLVDSPDAIVGTPAYMSPEQIVAPDEVDERSDIYGVGVILYEMLSGERPIPGRGKQLLQKIPSASPQDVRSHDSEIPQELGTVCMKAIAKSPVDRFPSAEGFAEDLTRVIEGEPIVAKPPGSIRRLWLWTTSPLRIRQTGNFIAGFGAVLMAVELFGMFCIATGLHLADIASDLREFDFFLCTVAFLAFGAWTTAIGRRIHRGNLHAMYLGIASSLGLFVWEMLVFLDVIYYDFGGFFENRSAREVAFFLFMVLTVPLILAHVVAILAQGRYRRLHD